MNDWTPLVGAALAAIPIIQAIAYRRADEDRRRADQAREALAALREAALRTRGYITKIRNGSARDVEREHEISVLWRRCGDLLRGIHEDLSRRCDLKGRYWMNPDEWGLSEINEARIGLDLVYKQTERLLVCGVRPE